MAAQFILRNNNAENDLQKKKMSNKHYSVRNEYWIGLDSLFIL